MVRCTVDRVTIWVFWETAPTELMPRTLVERRDASDWLDSTTCRLVPDDGGGGCVRAADGVVGWAGFRALLSFRRCEIAAGGGACVLRSPCESRLMNLVKPLLLSRPVTLPVCRLQAPPTSTSSRTPARRRLSASQFGSSDHRRRSLSL